MDKNTIKTNNEYRDRISKGDLKLLALGDSGWDYYINANDIVYSVAKTDDCCSSYFGSLKYYKKVRDTYDIN